MFAHAIQAEAHDDPGPHDSHTQVHQQVLHDLITMGADLARLLHGQVAAHAAQQAVAQPIQQATDMPAAPPSGAFTPDALISLALAFDRIARAVRRSILLARSLAKPIQPARDPAQDFAQHRAAARRRIIREVEDAIQRTGTDGRDAPETLNAELRDRLDAPGLDDDISTRPAADIISEICRDLGLAALPGTRPWKRRTPEDIAHLCAAAARQPGPAPQPSSRGVAQPTPSPHPDKPAARPRPQPGPIHARSTPPEDPAKTLAKILSHPTRAHGRWPPPPA